MIVSLCSAADANAESVTFDSAFSGAMVEHTLDGAVPMELVMLHATSAVALATAAAITAEGFGMA